VQTKITYKEIFALALPIYGGLLAGTVVGMIDTAFLGRVSLAQQSAAGYGALFYLVFFVAGMGFTLGTQILIARRIGEGNSAGAGPIFWNGLLCMLGYATLVYIFFNTSVDSFFHGVTRSEEISALTADYLRIRSFGVYGTMINLSFTAYYVGKGRSLAISLSAIASALVNVIAGYAMIFGYLGSGPMGIKGAAIANAVSDLSGTAVFILFTLFQKDLRIMGMFSFFPSLQRLREILNIAVPLILQNMISILAWFLFFTIIENTGKENFGISIIVRSVYSIFMMAPMALGSATNSMVSNLIGQQRQNEVLALVRKTGKFSLMFMLITLVPLILVPRTVFLLFSTDSFLAEKAVPVMYTTVAALAAFSVSNVIFQSVSGTGQTRTALLIETGSIALYILYTFLASQWFPDRLPVIWVAEVLYMVFFGTIAYRYMRSGNWKKKKI